jgi:hypothetical protein
MIAVAGFRPHWQVPRTVDGCVCVPARGVTQGASSGVEDRFRLVSNHHAKCQRSMHQYRYIRPDVTDVTRELSYTLG